MQFFCFSFVFPFFPPNMQVLGFYHFFMYVSCCDQKQFNVVLLFIQKDIWDHFDILHNISLPFFFPVVHYSDRANHNLNEKINKC